MRSIYYFLFISIVFVSTSAWAEDVDLEAIVVTPSRTEESIAGTTGSVTVFNRRDIAKGNTKGEDVKDLIVDAPGLDIVQAGTYGGPVSVFTRGTNAGQTQIMIDGVRMYDPISPNGAFDLSHFTLDNVDRIEVVNGPQSVLYGSDAMGGVINIITKKGTGTPTASFLASGATYNSHKEELESSGKIDSLSYSLGFSRFDTEGIPQLKDTSKRDPYDNTSVSLRADYDLNQQNTAGIIGRFNNAEFDYQSQYEPTDPNLNGKEKQVFLSSYIDSKMNERWEQKLQLSYSGNYRRDFDDPSPQYPSNYLRDWYNGVNYQADWQHTIELARFDSLIAGIDYQQEYGSSYLYSLPAFGSSPETIFPERTAHTIGYYFQNHFNIEDRFHLNTGIRLDDHSNFGLHQTYKIDSSYLFSTGTKIKGGWGTAFKAPTLYQLYVPAVPSLLFNGGNPNLKPEESSTYEIGTEQSILNDKVNFGVTYFHTDTTNLIDAIYEGAPTFITDSYANIGKARIFGYEAIITVKPVKQVKFDMGYTWQHTENMDTGAELLRRPENKYFSKIRYTPTDKLEFGLKFNYVGKREDSGNVSLKAYSKVDLDASYKFNPNAELFVSIDNIASESYEEVAGWAEPGRTFLGGLKFTF